MKLTSHLWQKEEIRVKYRPIPDTPLTPSVICCGTSSFGSGSLPQQAAFTLLDRFVDLGGNFLDTAKVYADWLPGERSVSEKTIGRWMKERGNRSRIVLATKGAHPDLRTMHIPRLAPEDIIGDLEQSLRNLQTDCIDLYWLHRDDPTRSVSEIVDVLNEQLRLGRIRAFGCSNWRSERIAEAAAYAARRGLRGFAASQPGWSLAEYPAPADPTMVYVGETERAYHERSGLPVVPYNSQASGLFGGRYRPEGLLERTEHNRKVWRLCTDENRRRLERVLQVARRTGKSGSQVALAYLLSQPFPVFPVIGSRTAEQLEDSCAAGDMRLDAETIRYLENG